MPRHVPENRASQSGIVYCSVTVGQGDTALLTRLLQALPFHVADTQKFAIVSGVHLHYAEGSPSHLLP